MKFSKPVSKDFTNASQLASNAQSTANNALANATQAIGSADGKNTNYFGTDHTTQNGVNGDLYYQTNADKTVSMYQYNNGWQLIASDAAGFNFGAINLVYNSDYSNNAYGWNTFGIGYLSNYPLSMYNGSQGFGLNISGKGTNTWTQFGESKRVTVPTTTVDSTNVFSFSAMVKIYEHSVEATVSVTLAFFDSNGVRIYPWKDVTVHEDILDGTNTIWQKCSFDGFAYPTGTVTMAIQYWAHGDTMHAMVANPIITQTSANVPYHSGQTTIKADNIIGGTFDGARANLININAASISTGTLNANAISINSSTGKVNQYQGGDTPWMPWIWDSSTFDINNGFISTTAKNAVVPGQGFTANAVGTYSPTYLKFTMWDPNSSQEYGRSYLDGGGLYIGLSANMTSVNPGSVESAMFSAREEIDVGNIKINNAHSFYSEDGGDLWFRGGDDKTSTNIHALAFKSTSLLSQKTNLSPLSPEEAMNALLNTDIYKYQYISDLERGSSQQYASLIIDDVNATKQYKADKAFINPEGNARDDGIVANYSVQAIKYLYEKLNDQQQQIYELKQQIKDMKEGK